MTWTKWIAELLAAAIGAWLGALVGYRRAYSEEKGKNLATYEDIKSLLAQEFGKAYEQEKGKRAATHEDIENVLREVRAVTRETETIKAQIGSDFWMWQNVWQQKRELYANLLNSSHALREILADLSAAQRDFAIGPPQNEQASAERFRAAQEREVEQSAILNREFRVAELFLNEPAIALVKEFRSWKKQVGQTSETSLNQRIQILDVWTDRLIVAAKQDLGAQS